MNTETIGFSTANKQTFVSGIQGFSNSSSPVKADPNAVSPNAIRWLFNPFEFIDRSAHPVSGHGKLAAGKFIPYTSQNERVSKSGISSSPGKAFNWSGNMPQDAGTATPGVPGGEYYNQTRTAYACASEVEDMYAERGVKILDSLTNVSDEPTIEAIYQTLVAPGLVYNNDPYQADYPIPNLILLETYLRTQATEDAATLAGTIAVDPRATVAELLVSVRAAIQYCRNITRDRKRHVANKTLGHPHSFDAHDTRCFIALGEKVPSDLPFVSEDGQMIAAGAAQANSSELERLRAENEELRRSALERENEALRLQVEQLKAGSANAPAAEKIACDFIKANGEQCKGKGINGRCPSHPRENIQENTNAERNTENES